MRASRSERSIVFIFISLLVVRSTTQLAHNSSIRQPQSVAIITKPVAKAHGYVTDQRQLSVGVNAVGGQSACVAGTASCDIGYDFNPLLLGGVRGYPGIRARINSRGFQYASTLIAPILSQQIKAARIPNINQCIPQVNGCIQVYNIYVSRFRCPQRVIIFPAPPNQIVVSVENLDVGVTGNLGGQINILVPIALFGIVQLNAHQVSLRVSLIIDRSPSGGVYIRVASCFASVGYVDVYIENGGLIGDIANSQFRGRISETVRSMIPGKLCEQLPGIVNEKLNGQLASIPQSISLTQILQVALNNFGLTNLLSGDSSGQCPSSCSKRVAAAAQKTQIVIPLPPPKESFSTASARVKTPMIVTPTVLRPVTSVPPYVASRLVVTTPRSSLLLKSAVPLLPPNQVKHHHSTSDRTSHLTPPSIGPGNKTLLLQPPPQIGTSEKGDSGNYKYRYYVAPKVHSAVRRQQPNNNRLLTALSQQRQSATQGNPAKVGIWNQLLTNGGSELWLQVHAPSPTHVVSSGSIISAASIRRTRGEGNSWGQRGMSGRVKRQVQLALQRPTRPRAYAPSPNHLAFPSPSAPNPCAGCPSTPTNPLSFLLVVLQSLDFSKLSNIYLTLQVLNTFATNYDYTIDLNGEFSPGGAGGTPFGAFPMYFPQPIGDKMAEVLISDWTLNSLFYHLHRVGFISVRIGPETPKIGDLLKTTCSSDEEDGGLEDHGVETDESSTLPSPKKNRRRRKRQDLGGGSLSELGICIGDILPAVKEKYPKQKIVVAIRSARAPSVLLSSRNGGTATLDFVLNADIYIESTNVKVGTIQVAATVDFTVKTGGGRLSAHAEITQLQLRDVGNQLGLPQDALDNLGNLGKEIILKAGNDALEKGVPLNIPSSFGGLPINFISPEIRILDHALHIASDFTINPGALAQLGGGGGC